MEKFTWSDTYKNPIAFFYETTLDFHTTNEIEERMGKPLKPACYYLTFRNYFENVTCLAAEYA